MRRLLLALGFVVAAPVVAEAHIQLTYPLPRTELQKDRHCGAIGSTRSANPTVLEPGATITVTWNETIGHPGHYRISFDDDGEDFTIPLAYDDFTQTENVLVDNIPDNTGTGSYAQEITLPDIECEGCTLQLIQMMTDKAPYEEHLGEANDIYFLCADIALRVGGGPAPDPEGPDGGIGADDDGGPSQAIGGCSTGGDVGLGTSLLLAIVLLLRIRCVRPARSVRERSLP
jgi:hypothetical protein